MTDSKLQTPHAVDIHVGMQIRARRKALGLSQEKLADHLELTFQQVQKYERGANRVSASKLYDIAELLKVSPGFFFPPPADDEAVDYAPTNVATQLVLSKGGVELAEAYLACDGFRRSSILSVARAVAGTAAVMVAADDHLAAA